MTVTVGVRTLVSFAAGVAVAVIALVVFQAVTADAAPGDDDATFVPITACRLADTRPAPDRVGTLGAFGADATETLAAHGSNGQCSLPSDAVGLTLNVTAVNASASTFLTVWGDGARPQASSLNPTPGQPPTPNAVTVDLAGDGSFKIYNLAGTVQVIVDVTGYYTDTSLKDLHNRLAALEAKTAAMSVQDAGSTVRFTGVDVQIVDGTGDTQCNSTSFEECNGTGNLIIGYNEDTGNGGEEVRSGSHNFVTGIDNDYTSHSGIAAGASNTISGAYAAITGGGNNTASGRYSSMSGGSSNTASGAYSSVSGGSSNTASGTRSSVSGGAGNTASDVDASVSGGVTNTASGIYSSVSGGQSNTASGISSSVSGGSSNDASGTWSSVSGGGNNTASGDKSSVSGGDNNEAGGDSSSVSGGQTNSASGIESSVSGGFGNTAGGAYSSVSGGGTCIAGADYQWGVGSRNILPGCPDSN